MMKALVVFYSMTGNTEKVARELARRLEADIEVIEGRAKRSGAIGRLRSVFEAIFKIPAENFPSTREDADYDIVVLGGPVWAKNMASPVRAFIRSEGAHINNLAVFCTEMGSGGAHVLDQMAALWGGAATAKMTITDDEIKSDMLHKKVSEFADAILSAQ